MHRRIRDNQRIFRAAYGALIDNNIKNTNGLPIDAFMREFRTCLIQTSRQTGKSTFLKQIALENYNPVLISARYGYPEGFIGYMSLTRPPTIFRERVCDAILFDEYRHYDVSVDELISAFLEHHRVSDDFKIFGLSS